jgi:putative intracellular protease/amidase
MGWYLPELAHPFEEFTKAGYEVTVCSINGGATTVTPDSITASAEDAVSMKFWEGAETKALTESTAALSTFKGTDFDVVFFVGGFGVMLDFPFSADVDRVGREAYENGGTVGAVCHGPIAFANIKLSNGELMIAGKACAGFCNEEEAMAGLLDKLPEHEGKGKSCEDVLTAVGAQYSKGGAWGAHIAGDKESRVFSGQNPASAGPVAAAIVASLA